MTELTDKETALKLALLRQEIDRLQGRYDAVIKIIPQKVTFRAAETDDEHRLVTHIESAPPKIEEQDPQKGWPHWRKVEKTLHHDAGSETPSILILETDISQHKEQEMLLKNIRQNLDDFAALTSHDLQAPLRHIGIFSEMLDVDHGHVLNDTAKDYLSQIRANVENMRVQIDGFLRFIHASPTGITLDTVNFSEIVAQTHEKISETLNDIGATLSVPKHPVLIQGDAAMIEQALRILFDNCIKYRAKDRPLTITVQQELQAGITELHISDTGMGIDPEQSKSLFDLFSHTRPLPDQRPPSVGLALCKHIMVFHGGNIEYIPQEQGACFALRFKSA